MSNFFKNKIIEDAIKHYTRPACKLHESRDAAGRGRLFARII
jgi:hypothetical protein